VLKNVLEHRILGIGSFAGRVVLDVTIGMGLLGLWVLILGRSGVLAWWSVGIPVFAVGLVGAARLARACMRLPRLSVDFFSESRLAAAAAAILAVHFAFVVIWAAAPEAMYDALYAKAWLPARWLHDGEIGSFVEHPVLGTTGIAQMLSVPGHALGAPDVGRYLQLGAGLLLVVAVWRWGARSASYLGPVSALSLAITPHVVWQASTAYDDLLLSVAVAAVVLTIIELGGRALPLVAGSVVAFAALGFRRDRVALRLAGSVAGAIIVVGPGILVRWITTGNPVFPQYNQIFHSRYYPPVNETWNFPYFKPGAPADLLDAAAKSILEPSVLGEALPPGAFGVLIAWAAFVSIAVFRRGNGRGAVAATIVLAVALTVWWLELRYLRYALPLAVATVVVGCALAASRTSFPMSRLAAAIGVMACAIAAILFFPSTLASFWNVPQRFPLDVALGKTAEADYTRQVVADARVLQAFNAKAEPGAVVVGGAYARTLLRSDLDLTPRWELDTRVATRGLVPTTADELRRAWAALGVRWLVLADQQRLVGDLDPITRDLVERYGQIVFGGGGRDLYRIVSRPPSLRPLPMCDPLFVGKERCWGPGVDDEPGLSAPEAAAGSAQSFEACPGVTYSMRVVPAKTGAGSRVWLGFSGQRIDPQVNALEVYAGRDATLYGTAPPGAESVTVSFNPLGPDARIEKVEIFGTRPPDDCEP
jgi:hypothetical protein